MSRIWLTAQYHLPSGYMCRMPMSSSVAARVLPTPGPATIRLALISNAIELFGIRSTREQLFPTIRAMPIRIHPPQQVAISQQLVKRYKGIVFNKLPQLQGALGYYEVAVADGPLLISLNVESELAQAISETLYAIGAWGSADSLAFCEQVSETVPPEEVVIPLHSVSAEASLRRHYIGLATEFRDQYVTWEEIGAGDTPGSRNAIIASLWVWPLDICEQRSTGSILRRCSHSNPCQTVP